MTNEEIILKSVQAHLTPAQRHEIAAAAYTPEQIAHAVEHIPDGLDELAAAPHFCMVERQRQEREKGRKSPFHLPAVEVHRQAKQGPDQGGRGRRQRGTARGSLLSHHVVYVQLLTG